MSNEKQTDETGSKSKTAPGDLAVVDALASEDSAEQHDWREQAEDFARQAKESARNAASSAKNTTGDALHGLSKIIGDTAGQIDDKLGAQYGDYARKAAEAVGGAADSLDEKDIDQLADDARDFVRKSPAVAIGAAAIVGFMLMRMMRSNPTDKS